MFTGLLSFLVFILSFSLLTNGEMSNDQCPVNPSLTSPEQYITRFHDGYTYSQRLDYLSSTVPSVQTSGFAAKQIEKGFPAASSDHALPHIAADANVWEIDETGDREAVCAPTQKENQMATEAAEEEDHKPEPGQHPQWVGKQYIIGLRDGVSVHSHVASLPIMLRDQIEQVIPEISGYALPARYNLTTSPLHHSILASIRKDPSVGFIVPKPRGFFSADGDQDLTGEEAEDYKEERMWSTLQYLDPGVQVTDDGAEKIPLSWVISFSTAAQKTHHLQTIIKDLPLQHNGKRGYFVVFATEEQEKEYLEKIHNDESVKEVKPQRLEKGIWYDVWDEEVQEWVTV